jgi:hypothetical protein
VARIRIRKKIKMQLKGMASPSFGVAKLATGNLQDVVDVHEDRVRSWMLSPAREILKHPHSEFASLSIVLPYFESHAILCKGRPSDGKSAEFFSDTFCEVFPPAIPGKKLDKVPFPADFHRQLGKRIYKFARCGLFHHASAHRIAVGAIDGPIWLSVWATPQNPESPIPNYAIEISGAIINPELFLQSVELHFDRYLATLRNPKNKDGQERFHRGWKILASTPPGIFPELEE